jgi:hypothetical protein
MKRNYADYELSTGSTITFDEEPEPEVIVLSEEPIQRFRFDRELGELVPVNEGKNFFMQHEKRADYPSPAVSCDYKPYKTVAADVAAGGKRTIIDGRRAHSEFLKRNNYQVIGNDYDKDQVLGGKPRRPGISAHREERRKRVEAIKRSIDDHRSGRIKRGEVSPSGER